MKKCLLFISIFIISTFAMADQTSDALNSIYNTTGKELCNRAITEKSKEKTYSKLKLKDTKLDGLCLLTTKTAMNQCFEKNIEFYSPYAKSPDKVRANNILSNMTKFCAAYADAAGTPIIDVALQVALKENISTDEAVNKLIAEQASKK